MRIAVAFWCFFLIGCQADEVSVKSIEIAEYYVHDQSIKNTRLEKFNSFGQLIQITDKNSSNVIYREEVVFYEDNQIISKQIIQNGIKSEHKYIYGSDFMKIEHYKNLVLTSFILYEYSNDKDRTITLFDGKGEIQNVSVETYLKENFAEMSFIDYKSNIYSTMTVRFNEFDQPIEYTNVINDITTISRFEYDEHGNQISSVEGDNNAFTTTYIYDNHDNIVEKSMYFGDDLLYLEKRRIKY